MRPQFRQERDVLLGRHMTRQRPDEDYAPLGQR
jgi:hypothetical protein